MKRFIIVYFFVFTIPLLCMADLKDEFDPIPGGIPATGPLFGYIIERENNSWSGVINSIALPSELEQGKHVVRLIGGQGGWEEKIAGPGRVVMATGYEYYPTWITPRCINGTAPGQNSLARAPIYFPYDIHFAVIITYDFTCSFNDLNNPDKLKLSLPFSAKAITGNLMDWNTSAAIPYSISTKINSQSKLVMAVEFNLPGGKYAYITVPDGSYTWNSGTQGQTNGSVYFKNIDIRFTFDNRKPNTPDNIWIDPKVTGTENNNTIYYTKENTTALIKRILDIEDPISNFLNIETEEELEDNCVTLKWEAVEDNGVALDNDHGQTISGIGGYYIYEKINGNWDTNPIVIDTPSVMGKIPLDEGRHVVGIKAYDKAGNLSENYGEIIVVVDRTGPDTVNTVNLKKSITVNERKYAILEKSPSLDEFFYSILWNESDDRPGSNNAGTAEYEVSITSLNTATPTPTPATYIVAVSEVDNSKPEKPIKNPASGEYEVKVRAYDRLSNYCNWSTPALSFYIDTASPQAPNPATFTIDKGTGGGGIFNTTVKDVTLTFNPATDGTQTWQSGVASYMAFEVINEKKTFIQGEINITTNEITMTCPNLRTGENKFIIKAKDAVGNEGPETTIIINKTELSPVTFPYPCYSYENSQYNLLWIAPATIPSGVTIAFYKAIIKNPTDSAPTQNEFNDAPELSTTQTPLAGIPQGEEQTAYVQATDTQGNTSIGAKTFTLPPLSIEPGEPYTLSSDEWWSGIHDIQTTVIVPAGITLTILPGTEVRITAHKDIQFIINGILDIQGEQAVPVQFTADETLYNAWKGIYVTGQAEINYTEIRYALRGITITPGSTVTIENTNFIHNRVGLHAYGETAAVTDTTFDTNQWYGVKEDASAEYGGKRPVLIRCIFRQNGYDYYHELNRDITMEELNQVPGNSENRREDE